MKDFLDKIIEKVNKTIESNYYATERLSHDAISLRDSILDYPLNPIITEIKLSSPSAGIIKKEEDIQYIASSMEKGGAVGISILTEPHYFQGNVSYFSEIRKVVSLPLLMKDFIISPIQIDTASNIGADVILLIQALFDRGYSWNTLDELINLAHSYNIEVLLETHTPDEFQRAIKSQADLIGINNRDLTTLKVDLKTTEKILHGYKGQNQLIISESGIESVKHIRFLRETGASAFLVGTAVISALNIEQKVRKLVEA